MRRALLLLCVLLTGCSSSSPPPAPEHHALRVVYAVSDGTTQTVDVDRPYRARTGVFLWTEDGTYLDQDGTVRQTAALPPGFPGPYSRLDVALPEALRQGLVRDLGSTRTVAGRPCHEWESRQPLDGAPFARADDTRTVSCVDDALGLVLADRWTTGTRLLRSREATSVGDGPALDRYTDRAPSPQAVITPAPAPRLLGLLEVPEPAAPPGLTLDKSVAVVDRETEAAVLTWVSGDRMLVLRLARSLVRVDTPTQHGAPVLVGTRRGLLEPVLAGLRLHLTGPRGLQVTVTSDLPRAALLSWAGGLDLGQ